jgi:hypothetical protein
MVGNKNLGSLMAFIIGTSLLGSNNQTSIQHESYFYSRNFLYSSIIPVQVFYIQVQVRFIAAYSSHVSVVFIVCYNSY